MGCVPGLSPSFDLELNPAGGIDGFDAQMSNLGRGGFDCASLTVRWNR